MQYDFGKPVRLSEARIVFDSDLNRRGKGDAATNVEKNILSNFPLNQPPRTVPPTIVKAFRIEALMDNGEWQTVAREDNNYQRLARVPLDCMARSVRLVPVSTWGADTCKLFAFEVK